MCLILGSPSLEVILNPSFAMIEAGENLRFFAAVTDEYSNPVQAAVAWSLDVEGQIGTMNNGIFSASKVGSGNVLAEVDGIRAVSEIVVTHGMLREIAVFPLLPSIGEIAAGETVQFIAEGYDIPGNNISIAPIFHKVKFRNSRETSGVEKD